MPAAPPPSATSYRATSALAAAAAARAALKARSRSIRAAWAILVRYQIAQAVLAERAVDAMLTDQDIAVAAEALLNGVAFTTEAAQFERMAEKIATDWQFERLVESLVQDTGRTAQQVAVAARPRVGWVRHLTLPSCSRCAVLAGRVYRFSQGFERHPGCDCTMIPITAASPDYTYDPKTLAREGQVTGLSRADLEALRLGADFNAVVNTRLKSAGLTESGRVLTRAGRLTPEGIFRTASDREEALALLQRLGYLR